MALRLKTIEYAFPQNEATLALATSFTFAAITLNIPENTSRTFRSVIIEVSYADDVTAATSQTSWLIGVQLAAVAFSDVTVTNTITHSGENQTYLFTRDVTSYFNTNFGSGTSQTCGVRLTLGAIATENHNAKLIITYEFDDASQDTRVKTVRIPLESFTGALTTGLTEMGTNQVPNLDTFLPESTKTYRNIWFEVSGNQGTTAATTDHTLNLALDAEGADADFAHETALASDVWYKRIWVRNSMATNATHAFKAAVSATNGATHNHLTVLLCVTYEYSHTSSSTIMNSIIISINRDAQIMGRTVAGDQSLFRKTFYIEEPTTITLVQSGVIINFGVAVATLAGLNVAIGSQADRAYTHSGTQICGGYSLIQRCDSGSAQGAGISIARGLNTITVECYNTDGTNMALITNVNLYLNYTSGKASGGADTHNKTVFLAVLDHAATASQRASSAVAFNVPETSYWVNSMSLHMDLIQESGSSSNGFSVKCARASGEKGGDGWEELFNVESIYGDAENGVYCYDINIHDSFDRYPNEQQDRLAIETTRIYRIYQIGGVQYPNLYLHMTYHSITVTKSGTISGSAGGTVNIGFWRIVNDIAERLDTTSRAGNGVASITWYDDTENVFSEGRESSTLVGRSDTGAS